MTMVEYINNIGNWFCDNSLRMLIQSGVLVLVLYAVDLLIRKRVRAVVRYCMWMLVLVKLVLPTTLSVPTGLGYWVDLKDKQLITKQEPAPAAIPAVATNITSPKLSTDKPTGVESMPGTNTTATQAQPALPELQVAENTAITAPAVAIPPSASEPVTIRGWLFLGWLVGVLVLTVLFLQRYWFVRSLIAQSRRATEPETIALLDSCRELLDMPQAVEMRLTNNMLSPAVCGLTKPVVLMPVELLNSLEPEKLQSVLLHELCHIKRRDLWVNLAQSLLQILYFFNPMLWLANIIIRQVREKAVDEMVLSKLGSGSKIYCNTLIDIAGIAFTRPHLSLRLIGVVESKSALQDRIKHIIARPLPKSARLGWISTAAVLVMAAVLLPMAKGTEQDKTDADNAKTSISTDKNNEDVTPDNTNKGCIAQLPGGVTLELIGVCDLLNDSKKWWSPDGTHEIPLIDYYYDPQTKVENSRNLYALALKTSNWDASDVHIYGVSSNDILYSYFPRFEDEARTKLRSIQCLRANIDSSKTHETFTIELGVGKWKFTADGGLPDFPEGGSSTLDNIFNRQVRHNGIKESNGETEVSVLHLIDKNYDCRIVAIGKDGKTYCPTYTSNLDNDIRECRSSFDVPLANIQGFSLETRPRTYITFENVALRQGEKTEVKVSTQTTNDTIKFEPKVNPVNSTELTGHWEMASISGDGADTVTKIVFDFKPGNMLTIDAETNDGPRHLIASYTLDDSKIEIINQGDNHTIFTGSVDNNTLDLLETSEGGKLVMKKVENDDSASGTNGDSNMTELTGRWEMASMTGEEAASVSSVVIDFKPGNMLMIDAITDDGSSHGLCRYTLENSKIEIIDDAENEKILIGFVNIDTMELLGTDSDSKIIMKKDKIAHQSEVNLTGSTWELTGITGNGADAYRSAKLYVESDNMVRLEAEMTNGPVTVYGAYSINNDTISITNTENGFVMSGTINGHTMSLSSADGDLKTTMKKIQDWPATNTYTPATTGNATELTGRWEMISASGDEAGELKTVTIDFKPGNKLMIDIDNIDGPQHALCSYTLNNGIIKITGTNRDLQVGGIVNNDGTLELIEDNTKVLLRKVSPTAISTGSNSANQATYRENNRNAVTSQLLGEWTIVDSTIYINDTDKSNYNGTFDFVTSGNVVFEGKYYAKDAYIEDMEYTTDDQGRIEIIATDSDTTLSGYLKNETLILIDSDGSAKLTLQRTDSLTQEYKTDKLTNQLAGKWNGMQADSNGRYEVTLEFKTADFVIVKIDNSGDVELREYPYIIEGKDNNRLLINDHYPCYINDNSLELLIDGKQINLYRNEPESKTTKATDTQILTTVRRFISAVQAEDPDGIMDCIYIENDEHKQRLEQFIAEGNPELDYIRAKSPEIVEVFPYDNGSFAVLTIIKSGDNNVPQTIPVTTDASGNYKIKRFSIGELEQMQLAKTLTAEEYGKKIMNDQQEKWLKANSVQLAAFRQDLITTAQRNLIACQYAKAHNIEMWSGFDENSIKAQLEQFNRLTPEQIRAELLKEAQANQK